MSITSYQGFTDDELRDTLALQERKHASIAASISRENIEDDAEWAKVASERLSGICDIIAEIKAVIATRPVRSEYIAQ